MKSIKVVCGIIWKEGKVLIARRRPEKYLGGYWEFPGGKIRPDEDPLAALERELQEEMGMTLSNIRYYGDHNHSYETFLIELIAYECDFQSATFQLTDHDTFEFVAKESLSNFKIAPADLFFVKRLNQFNTNK